MVANLFPPLFRRTGRQVLLTDAGQAALPLLTSAFEMMAEAVHHMRAPARRDRLMISSAPSFAAERTSNSALATHPSTSRIAGVA